VHSYIITDISYFHPALVTVAGFSYWILEGEKYHGISVQNSKSQYLPHVSCDVEFVGQDEDLGDYAQISPVNMILPIMTFLVCALTAIVLHLFRKKKVRRASTNALRSVPRAVKSRLPSLRAEEILHDDAQTTQVSKRCSLMAPKIEFIPMSDEEQVENLILDADEAQPK